ncbi:hypothetical protein [Bdellovibrio sp. HCB337]|uniref:hypothetical protein n=1 Tax=Bdellovibrio sp. HCB337 TaxID=3394358 RepID=UPI0039A4A33E
MSLKTCFFGLSLIISSSLSFAAEPLSQGSEASDIILTTLAHEAKSADILTSSDPSLANQEITLVYDPKDFDGVVDTGSKEELLRALRAEMAAAKDEKALLVPKAPQTEEQLEKLAALSEHDVQSFLGKKQKFLERMAKVLTFFHLKTKLVNKVLAEVNTKFYNSARLIAGSNSAGVTVMFSLSGGLALPKKIMSALQGRALGKLIPKSGGFFYLVGFGVGVSRHVQPNGKPNWVLEAFMDTERLKSTITGIVEISGASTFGVVYELREGKFKQQQSETTYGGLAGVFRQGPNQFGWAASLGMSLPPGIGSVIVYTDQSTRRYLARIDVSNFTEKYLENTQSIFLSWMDRTGLKKVKPVCAGIF